MLDIYAQVSAHALAARSIREFLGDSGLDGLDGISSALQERADRAMRSAIAALRTAPRAPKSSPTATTAADRIACALTVCGETLTVDYCGTSAQVDRGLNCVLKLHLRLHGLPAEMRARSPHAAQ